MDRFGGKQSGGSGAGKDDPGKSGSGPGKTSLVDQQLGGGATPTMTPVAPVASKASQAVTGFPAMNIAGEVQTFSGGGVVAALLVAADEHLAERAVAQHTIAMFQYMHTHAGALAAVIAKEFQAIPEHERDQYLMDLSAAMMPKLGDRGLWVGGDDRGMICVDALDPTEYFKKGKVLLLAKATQAHAQNRPLPGLLKNHSANMDAKSYGRRVESLELIDIAALPAAGVAAGPAVGVPIACNDPLCKYLDDDNGYAPIAGHALVVGSEYSLNYNSAKSYAVTVASNDGVHVVFSAVTA